jgi:ADP-dependent NAD(P)H-hydrate dehydratase
LADYEETSADLLKRVIVPRRKESHKGDNGVVAIVGGSRIFHGAPYFASMAALRSGADLAYVGVPKLIVTSIRALSPELIVFPMADSKLTKGAVDAFLKWLPKVDSLVLGPGLGRQNWEGAKKLLVELCLERKIKATLDAEAQSTEIYSLIKNKGCVTTPHAGEFKRIFGVDSGSTLEQKIESTKSKAKDFGITVVLKGAESVISDGDTTFVNRIGSPAMTCGGIGDTISGVIGAMLAQARDTQIRSVEIAAAASFVVGSAGQLAGEDRGLHIIASDIVDRIPNILKPFDRVE